MNGIHKIKSISSDLRVRIILLSQGDRNSIVTKLAIIIDGLLIDFWQYKRRHRRKVQRAKLNTSFCFPSAPPEGTLYGNMGLWECRNCSADNVVCLDKYAYHFGTIRCELEVTCWNCGVISKGVCGGYSSEIDADLVSYWILNPTTYFSDWYIDQEYLELPINAVIDALTSSISAKKACEEKVAHLIMVVLEYVQQGAFESHTQQQKLYTLLNKNREAWDNEEQDGYDRRVTAEFLESFSA